VALGRPRRRDIEPPLFAPTPRHNEIELTPVSRFLPLTGPSVFSAALKQRADERKPCTHIRAHRARADCSAVKKRRERRDGADRGQRVDAERRIA